MIKIDGRDIRDYTIVTREHIGIVRQPLHFQHHLQGKHRIRRRDARIEDIGGSEEPRYTTAAPRRRLQHTRREGALQSRGQKQRIAIARALLKNPKILILDDSTSSVDTQTEHDIQQALDELLADRTTFIITQRLSSIKKADYIVVLDNGAVAEEGTHDTLITRDGIYRKLYDTQVSGGEKRGDD
jgi:ABC-type multidrug transport system fused ATPase/permease subunit